MAEHDFERIQPASLDIAPAPGGGAAPAAGVPVAREARPVNLATLLIVVLLVVAALVIFALPRYIEEAPVSQPAVAAPSAGAAQPAAAPASAPHGAQASVSPWEEAQRERERTSARAALDALLAVQYELQQRAVENWAASEFASATALARQGDEAYRANRFADAEQAWREGERQLRALQEGIPQRLVSRLAEGDAAFAAGDAGTATRAFTEALAIEAGNARATKGLERAGKLERLQALLAESRAREAAGDTAGALARLREALALDAEWEPAREARAALEARIAGEQATAHVSAGYAALAAGRIEQARSEFQAAIRQGAGAPARDGLQQAEFQASQQRIASLLARVTEAEQAERWKDALAASESALAVDASLAPARTSRERAAKRLALDEALEKIAREPQSLMSDAGRAAADKLLAAARTISAPGPRLQAQIATAAARLAEMRTEVGVTLVSDGKTEVTVFRVGGLGRFAEHRLALLPGDYVAVGTRDGYRDVRVSFAVRPGAAPAPVTVQCGQAI